MIIIKYIDLLTHFIFKLFAEKLILYIRHTFVTRRAFVELTVRSTYCTVRKRRLNRIKIRVKKGTVYTDNGKQKIVTRSRPLNKTVYRTTGKWGKKPYTVCDYRNRTRSLRREASVHRADIYGKEQSAAGAIYNRLY
jgi:hypothetical protein